MTEQEQRNIVRTTLAVIVGVGSLVAATVATEPSTRVFFAGIAGYVAGLFAGDPDPRG